MLRVRTGHVVVSTDVLVEGRHFRRDWASAADIGHRAAAANLSDVNAMGGRASSLTIGLAAPADLPVAWALEFAQGFAEEAALVGASVVGGDLTQADQVVIAVTVARRLHGGAGAALRAEAGDVVALAGRQGWAAGGLAVLGRGFRSPRVLVEAYRRPEPPYDAGPMAADAGATSMIDVSDGLVADAGHVAAASGVAIDLHRGGVHDPRASRGGRRRARGRPVAVHPGRRRRPLAAGHLPRRRVGAGGLAGRRRRCVRGRGGHRRR